MNAQPRSDASPDARAGGPAAAEAGRLLPELIALRAAATPDATALIAGERRVSYRELDERANRVAHLLAGRGAGPEALVGVCLHRGVDLVVALLGVWKSGAAYVPLDPSHPAERLAWVLGDTAGRLVLTESSLTGLFAEADAEVVALDTVESLLETLPGTAPEVTLTPDGAAYAIYTSGSTGRPKGVVIGHGGIANRVLWTVREHRLSTADRVLQKTSLSFDAAGWEIFAPLVSGGTVVLAPVGAERDPAALVRAVADHDVTVLQVVPSVLRLLVDAPGWDRCSALRLVFSAGEPLHAELCHRLLALTDVEVWNTYGPTECSIDVTALRFDPAQVSGPVSIGRPLDNMRVLILDAEGEPTPFGVPGELHVGGVGVARGYLGRPGLTAGTFVPDPYGPAGSRLYRTGDRARWRSDGTLEYLGRLDHQVKVNGVRIEPGEVEAALAAHPRVRGAVAAAFTDRDGAARLAAYVLGRDGAIDAGELRGFLRDRLPDHLVPSVFVAVDAFPLTTSGKVDRKALPAPDLAAHAGRPPYVAPRDEAERTVARVWSELLGEDAVGAHDDFFQLGGHSLLLARLAAELGAVAGAVIPLADLFAASTVEAQARLLTAERDEVPPVVPIERTGRLPLSHGQHRLWFVDRMNPGSSEYVVPLLLRVAPDTDADDVRRALDTLAARHEILRTRYVTEDGEPYQVVDAPSSVELASLDAPSEDLSGLVGAEIARGFDLEHGPVWRAALVRTPSGGRAVILTMHHIACDGWSSVVIEREFRELLAARAAGRTAELPAPVVQYADFAAWQRASLTDEKAERHLAHWRTALDGLAPQEFPTDRPRAAVRDPRGAAVTFTVAPEVARTVLELGRHHRATPFVTMLTALSTLAARHSGQWDVAIGTPVAGRDRPEVAGTVGFFLNSLVLRPRLTEDLSFEDALDRVRETCRSAFAHQDLPFQRVVDEMQPERDLSRTPLYQIALDLHDEGLTGVSADTDELGTFLDAWWTAHTDLTLYVRQGADGSLIGVLEYATALFDATTAERLTQHLVRLLESAAGDPTAPLGSLDILTPAERARLLTEWNDTTPAESAACVHELFEAQVLATPDAVAVHHADGRLTYAELDERANRFAHHLRDRGVGPESVVGVLLDRGPDLLACLLGVWKAGGAYVPLDPAHPAERLGYMLENAGARLVVTERRHTAALADAGQTAHPLVLEDEAEALAARPHTAPGVMADPDRIAYVIYTSGSTGRPKGVAVPHRGLANHLVWAAGECARGGTGGAPVFSSIAFDLPVPNLYAPLLIGQPVHLLPRDFAPEELGRLLVASGPYGLIKLTPGHLEMLHHQLGHERALGLAGTVIVAGEALTGRTANHGLELFGDTRLINEYGPTEGSVGSSVHLVDGPQHREIVPIGTPLPGVTLYVLDERMEPLPVGVAGELYVGGTGVARGYVNAPDRTAERFLPNPFGPPGSRLYRTGDLVRLLPTGDIDFLGRIDTQIKVRGYRIEPGEIQAVVTEHPGVREAVVVAHEARPGEKELVAYCVPSGATLPGAEELADHARTRLPEYMVPVVWVELENIPLNRNGKVDRAALPAPDRSELVSAGGFVAPRTTAEEMVAEIWTELLGVEVGVHNDFFQLGGHSILAIKLIARIQQEFDITLPARAVFEGPTVAQLAAAVEAQIRAELAQPDDTAQAAEPATQNGQGA
ncbi:amino acid adenylation domain-containing protein [Streptomyces abikoensis]|uniref:Amino acid adenylation domain-containing protein n=2 Tax=Streptomyces abikoensis TaxID=97398 RepID=A0ABW7T6V3_9ACTN